MLIRYIGKLFDEGNSFGAMAIIIGVEFTILFLLYRLYIWIDQLLQVS